MHSIIPEKIQSFEFYVLCMLESVLNMYRNGIARIVHDNDPFIRLTDKTINGLPGIDIGAGMNIDRIARFYDLQMTGSVDGWVCLSRTDMYLSADA